jgi:UDP-N-acetyl-D-mannosaminuronic acid dehydrogenase
MDIVVVGMGYVGIPTAALLANVEGFRVVGVQRRSERSSWKIDHINAGMSPIGGDEPGLAELIERVVRKGSFRVADDFHVCCEADVILIAVQTPVDENHVARYESLMEVTKTVGRAMRRGVMVVLESTVAPGTTEFVVKPILEDCSGLKAGEDFNLVFSPERVMAGRLLNNIRKMPRIIGGLTPQCTRRGVELYKNIVESELYETDCLTAEIAKLTENTYRDVNIAFANEIALICESLGANVHDVRRFVNALPFDPSDPSKNPYRMMHMPGAGVGGHCLPKDPWLLKYGLERFGKYKFTTKMLVESRRVNDLMPVHMKDLIEDALREEEILLKDSRICILGFAFLENSDDTRNTPAEPLYRLLKDNCREVVVHDPLVEGHDGVEIVKDLEEALSGKDCVALVTRHKEYGEISLTWLKKILATPIIVDGRNVFNAEECSNLGFTFRGVGIGVHKITQR